MHVEVHAYSAGRISQDIAQTMAATAKRVLRKGWAAAEAAGQAAAAALAGADISITSSSSSASDTGTTPDTAAAARTATQPSGGETMEIQMLVKYESPATAVGDGGGLLLLAVMDTGARLGWARPLEKKGMAAAEALAQEGAEALLECLASGAVVDEW